MSGLVLIRIMTMSFHGNDFSITGPSSLRWRHNGRYGVSNHQPHDCFLNRLFRRRSKKTSKLRITGLCAGNSPGTGELPAQMASYAKNVSIWWRHHDDENGGACIMTLFSNCFGHNNKVCRMNTKVQMLVIPKYNTVWSVNTLRQKQIGCYFTDNIPK